MKKKKMIMEKSMELFAKKGFNATSVQEITDYCGISKGSFYLSFKSKDEMIFSLIDHYMMRIVEEIDQLVKKNKEKESLIKDYYVTIFTYAKKHSDFNKFFFKEQMHSFNKELFLTYRKYEKKIDDLILTILEIVYAEKIDLIKNDLLYCIKGWVKSYSSLFLVEDSTEKSKVEIERLSCSLVEKTDLLAKNMTFPYFDEERNKKEREITKEELIVLINETKEKIKGTLEKESLDSLSEIDLENKKNKAIVIGLLKNIENQSSCYIIVEKVKKLLLSEEN